VNKKEKEGVMPKFNTHLPERELRMLPHDTEAEEAVLGCVIQENDKYDEAAEFIREPDFFYGDDCKLLWKIITKMVRDGKKIDYITLNDQLTEDQRKTCSMYWITGLTSNAPAASNIEAYARIVAEKFAKRQIIIGTKEMQDVAYNGVQMDALISSFSKYTQFLDNIKPMKHKQIDELVLETIATVKEGNNIIDWGIPSLSSLAGGLTRGEVSVIAGRPGHGKTTVSLNLAVRLVNQGLKVVMMNREMTNIEMVKKLIVCESDGLMYKDIRMNNLEDTKKSEMLDETRQRIKENYTGKLFMYDNVKGLPESISLIRKIKPDVVIDDYIQLIRVPGQRDRRFEIEDIMTEYKWLAKTSEHKPSIILLSQLNRDIEKRQDPVPKLSDLSEGGTIEQVAENVLFVYYDYKVKFNKSNIGKYGIQLFAAKVRYGETGQLILGFNGNRCKLYNTRDDVVYDS
tara:strand:- start:28894 stop:30264 length:1371 start_codon:yes stop_codon:yes gene_type:complete